TKYTKDLSTIEILQKQKDEGVHRILIGFALVYKGIPRHGYEIVDDTGSTIGVVTSGTQSPTLGKAIGLGYVQTAFAEIGTRIFIKVRDKQLAADVVKMPFV